MDGNEKHRREIVAMVGLLQYTSYMQDVNVTILTLLSVFMHLNIDTMKHENVATMSSLQNWPYCLVAVRPWMCFRDAGI